MRGSRDVREPPAPRKWRVHPRSSGSRDRASGAGEDADGRTAVGLVDHAALEPPGALAVERGEDGLGRSEEHTSELQSLMRISYAVFCLKKKTTHYQRHTPLSLINYKLNITTVLLNLKPTTH